MNQLRGAFGKAGLVSERQVRESNAAVQIEKELQSARLAQSAREKEKRMEILRKTTDPSQFRREARKIFLLYTDADLVLEIINLAHVQGMKEKKSKGGTWLIANLYQLREALQKDGLSEEAKKAIVDKLFANK